jgi:hypothetical protein
MIQDLLVPGEIGRQIQCAPLARDRAGNHCADGLESGVFIPFKLLERA